MRVADSGLISQQAQILGFPESIYRGSMDVTFCSALCPTFGHASISDPAYQKEN